ACLAQHVGKNRVRKRFERREPRHELDGFARLALRRITVALSLENVGELHARRSLLPSIVLLLQHRNRTTERFARSLELALARKRDAGAEPTEREERRQTESLRDACGFVERAFGFAKRPELEVDAARVGKHRARLTQVADRIELLRRALQEIDARGWVARPHL